LTFLLPHKPFCAADEEARDLLREGEFFFDQVLVGLREFGFGFDAETARIVEELIDGLVGDFAVEKFADARLRLR
jgi:hypothetical protein